MQADALAARAKVLKQSEQALSDKPASSTDAAPSTTPTHCAPTSAEEAAAVGTAPILREKTLAKTAAASAKAAAKADAISKKAAAKAKAEINKEEAR